MNMQDKGDINIPVSASLPSAMALAYLGDARHALYVRDMLVRQGLSKSGDLNRAALGYVTAEAQARVYRKIEPHLTEEEAALAHRAMNSGHLNRPKHASPVDYRCATGLEAVIGMLHYLGREARLLEILEEGYKETENDTED